MKSAQEYPGLNPLAMRASLLAWYDRHGRALPWRIRPEARQDGVQADPYKVWLSEIMLQQTTVPHATPYWQAFVARWPSVQDLASAPRDDVLSAWAGLGYYARARNLHKCAQRVSQDLGGAFPSTLEGLRDLPGVGDYTANAIRAVAFDQPASVVDGNVERVITRLIALETPLPKAKPQIKALAARLADPDRPGDYAQAIMDLGATICTPRSPDCPACPWQSSCRAFKSSTADQYPRKQKKKPKPVRRGACFHVTRGGSIWLRRRPETGLLGAMMELPGTDWEEGTDLPAPEGQAPFEANWHHAGQVRHVFTHFSLELEVHCATAPDGWTPKEGDFHPIDALDQAGLPSVMAKAARLGFGPRLV